MSSQPVLDFIARLFLVILFPFSALDKIFDPAGIAQADASGLPVPGWVLLLLGGSLEVFGSLGILFNVYRRQFALLFVFYCIATAVLFHNFWIYPFPDNWTAAATAELEKNKWLSNFWEFLKNFGLAGGFLFVAGNARMESLAGAFSLRPRPRD